jgi:hypothetical protein
MIRHPKNVSGDQALSRVMMANQFAGQKIFIIYLVFVQILIPQR